MNWKWIIIILVVVAVGIAAYFLFVPAKPAPSTVPSTSAGFGQPAQYIPVYNQSASPTVFATSFYAWYLQGIMSDQKFVTSDQFKSSINGWLTQDFASNWSTVAENTGSDPVLLAQDYQNSWITNIQATTENQTATTSTVLVSLGTSSELHKMIVNLVTSNGTWRISAVTPVP